jgi:hypothetical protein
MKRWFYLKIMLAGMLFSMIETAMAQSTILTPGGAVFNNDSTSKTVQLPKLTYEQIKAIVWPQLQEGMMVYDISSKCVRVYNGSEWVCLADSKSVPFAAPGYFSTVMMMGSINYGSKIYGIGCHELVTDSENSLYATGTTRNISLIGFTCGRSIDINYDGRPTAYLVKYNSTNQPLWCFSILGKITWASPPIFTYSDFYSSISSVKVSSDAVYITGHFNNTITLNGIDISATGGADMFIAKLNPANGAIVWFKKITNGTGDEKAVALQLDDAQNVYVSGTHTSNFVLDGSTNITNNGGSDFFIAKFNTNGILQSSIASGGSGDDKIADMEWSGSDLIAVGTFTNSLAIGGVTLTGLSGINMYLARLNTSLAVQNAYSYNTTGAFSVNDICNSSSGIYVSGRISGTAQIGNVSCENTSFLAALSTYSNFTNQVLKLTKGDISKIGFSGENVFGIINFSGNSSFDNIPIIGTFRDSDVALFKIKSSSNSVKWIKVLGDREPSFVGSFEYYERSSRALLIKSSTEILYTVSASFLPPQKNITLVLTKYVE